MKAMKCDRCGAFFELYNGNEVFARSKKANGLLLIDMDCDRKYWKRESMDLCPDCMCALERFLSGGGEAGHSAGGDEND